MRTPVSYARRHSCRRPARKGRLGRLYRAIHIRRPATRDLGKRRKVVHDMCEQLAAGARRVADLAALCA